MSFGFASTSTRAAFARQCSSCSAALPPAARSPPNSCSHAPFVAASALHPFGGVRAARWRDEVFRGARLADEMPGSRSVAADSTASFEEIAVTLVGAVSVVQCQVVATCNRKPGGTELAELISRFIHAARAARIDANAKAKVR